MTNKERLDVPDENELLEAIKEKNIGINTDRNTADLQYWQTSYMYDWRSFQVKTYADKLTVPKPIHFGGCDMFHVSSA